MGQNKQLYFDFRDCPPNKVAQSIIDDAMKDDATGEKAAAFATSKNVVVHTGKNMIYFFPENNTMYVYEGPCRIVEVTFNEDGSMDANFTEAIFEVRPDLQEENEVSHRTIEGFMTEGMAYFYISLRIFEGSLSKMKSKSGRFGKTVQAKELSSGKVRIYETDASLPFLYSEQDNGTFKVLYNGMEKKEHALPNKLYPMPNSLSPQIFCLQNTCNLDDGGELARILEGKRIFGQLGHCYQTCDDVISALKEAGYTDRHTVQFYAGWVNHDDPESWMHHAWVLVDGKSVIDLAHHKGGPIRELEKLQTLGKSSGANVNLQRVANKLKRYEKQDIPFTERFHYGSAENWCYIGTPSTSDEARASFNDLLRKFPDHPQYLNIDKSTGSNQLQREYYGDELPVPEDLSMMQSGGPYYIRR